MKTKTKANKYVYLHVVQGRYDAYGFEDVAQSESMSDALADLKSHRENEPGVQFRLIERRERNDAS